LGGGHGKRNGQYTRESNPVGKNEFNRKDGGGSAGNDAAVRELAGK